MRVLFNLLDADIGGGQRVALSIASEIARRGHALGLVVPAPGPASAQFRELGADVFTLEITRLARPGGVVRAARVARGFDLVYSHTSVPGAILASAAARIAMRPHVIHQHIYPHFSPRPLRRALQRRLFRVSLERATVIAVAEHVARDLTGLGISRSRIAVIPNAVSVPTEQGRARAPDEPVRIGMLGRLDPQKGIETFVAAAGAARLAGSATFSVGAPNATGGYAAGVRRDAAAAGVQLVEPGSDGVAFLRSLDIVAMPSRYEGSPLVLLEAMSLGKPVVASDIPGIREVVAPDAGVLVPPDDAGALAAALADLVDNPRRRDELGTRAREVIRERYELGRFVTEMIAVLETAAGR